MERKIGFLQRHRILLSAAVYLVCIVAVSYATLTREGSRSRQPSVDQQATGSAAAPSLIFAGPEPTPAPQIVESSSPVRPQPGESDAAPSSNTGKASASMTGGGAPLGLDGDDSVPEEGDPAAPKREIPLATMGTPRTPSALTAAPGYYPPDDPEAESSVTGRREAPLIGMEFSGGAGSPEDLAERILAALRANDRQALQSLRILPEEFEEILWPEFPQSRPITNLEAADAYFFLDRNCLAGMSQGLSDFGGEDLRLDRIEYEIGKKPFRNFSLYDGVAIKARTPAGEGKTIRFAQAFAERNGIWKVYTYGD